MKQIGAYPVQCIITSARTPLPSWNITVPSLWTLSTCIVLFSISIFNQPSSTLGVKQFPWWNSIDRLIPERKHFYHRMKPHIIIARLLSQYTVIYRSRRNMNFFGNLSNVPRDIIGTKSIPYQNYNLSIAGHSKVKPPIDKTTNLFVGKTTYTINLVFYFRSMQN